MKLVKHFFILLTAAFLTLTSLTFISCSPAKPGNTELKELVRSELQSGKRPDLFRLLYRRSDHKWAIFADSQFGWAIPNDSNIFSEPSLVNQRYISINEKSVIIKSIKIQEWGIFNEDGKYWPCKIRTIGSAILTGRGLKLERREFDAVVDYRFYKDDYGKWEVNWVL